LKHSKYILVEHDGKEWIVRTRNPPMIGEVITWNDGSFTFDLSPQKLVLSMSEQEIDKLTASMARWYYHAKGWPYGRINAHRTQVDHE
jgi:hypothetical protein